MSQVRITGGTPAYWRSLAERADTPEFREMVRRRLGENVDWENLAPSTRRKFLQVMGASLALAGLAGCRWPRETIVPFARPAGYTPGVPQRYATSMELAGVASGLVVTSYDGRPIKVDGNPEHPQNRGGSDLLAQASILDLYDPARSRSPLSREIAGGAARNRTWEEFSDFARGRMTDFKSRGGESLYILSEATSSPSMAAMRARLQGAFPRAVIAEYESISRDNERTGAVLAFGRPMRAVYSLESADVIVSLDADFLGAHPASVAHARDFAAGRRNRDRVKANRLYAVESAYTITGGKADHRFTVPSRWIPVVAGRLAAEILGDDPGARAALAAYTSHPFMPRFIAAMARDLKCSRGRSIIVAGPRQPADVHALAHAMNAALGNVGTTVRYAAEEGPERPSHVEAIASLADAARAGKIDTLIILGGNPVFDAPADIEFARALAAVPASAHLSLHEDETSRACHWHLPRAHYLESWGDARAWDGTVGITQPLIEPLYGGKSPIEVLSILCDPSPMSGYDIVRRAMSSFAGADFEAFWRSSLNDGFVSGSAYPIETPTVRPLLHIPMRGAPPAFAANDLEIVFVPDSKVYDGRFAGNAWLQELPDPMTKVTWDNAALISPATAAALGVRADDVVALQYGGREVEIPVYVMPGVADRSVIVPLGYGRTAAGPIGNGVGASAQALRMSGAMGFDGGLTVRRVGRVHALSCTQNHHMIDLVGLRETQRRVGELVREVDSETYKRNPEAVRIRSEGEPAQLFPPHDYESDHRWGMAIDLDSCTGCGACMIACQAENNVPVVGREQVKRGREMHWLRIDRYFSGAPERPEVSHQPLACVQCENAPCEQVCPVGATAHSHEGLNEMVYNRCIGTRYCANNCPYKVRRFNWFNFHKRTVQIEKMMYNPDVTVRGRGVMEKCTFCVQRIEGAKIRARVEGGRPIADGEVVPACAQACPSRAIVFGDLNDPQSRVHALHVNARSYGLLEEINTRPRTQYLAKLRNPNHDPEVQG